MVRVLPKDGPKRRQPSKGQAGQADFRTRGGVGRVSASIAIPLQVKKYGEKHSGNISWNIRRVGKELFSDPTFILKEALNNSVDEDASSIDVLYNENSL